MKKEVVILSPCVDICALDERDICIGCQRTGEEISRWGIMSNEEKTQVLRKIALREQEQKLG